MVLIEVNEDKLHIRTAKFICTYFICCTLERISFFFTCSVFVLRAILSAVQHRTWCSRSRRIWKDLLAVCNFIAGFIEPFILHSGKSWGKILQQRLIFCRLPIRSRTLQSFNIKKIPSIQRRQIEFHCDFPFNINNISQNCFLSRRKSKTWCKHLETLSEWKH